MLTAKNTKIIIKNYYQKLNDLVHSIRKELKALEIPFIIGGLGDYQTRSNILKPLDNEANIIKELCEREHTIAEKRYIALEQFTLGKGSMKEVMSFFN